MIAEPPALIASGPWSLGGGTQDFWSNHPTCIGLYNRSELAAPSVAAAKMSRIPSLTPLTFENWVDVGPRVRRRFDSWQPPSVLSLCSPAICVGRSNCAVPA